MQGKDLLFVDLRPRVDGCLSALEELKTVNGPKLQKTFDNEGIL